MKRPPFVILCLGRKIFRKKLSILWVILTTGRKVAAKPNSKFRRVTIHGKTYYFYEIRWIDVLGDTGHASLKEFAEMKPARMVTNAYIFKKDKKFIWTFASYDVHDEVFSDRNLFPVGVIEGLKRIAIT